MRKGRETNKQLLRTGIVVVLFSLSRTEKFNEWIACQSWQLTEEWLSEKWIVSLWYGSLNVYLLTRYTLFSLLFYFSLSSIWDFTDHNSVWNSRAQFNRSIDYNNFYSIQFNSIHFIQVSWRGLGLAVACVRVWLFEKMHFLSNSILFLIRTFCILDW